MDEDAFDDYLEEDDDEDAELSMDEMPVIRPPPMIEKMVFSVLILVYSFSF